MRSFQVLNRALDLHQHYLLEASAGTGKTFAIQHLVVRLLLKGYDGRPPFRLDQIVVLTFTRAAAHELKQRIRENIVQALAFLQGSIPAPHMPDYLVELWEKEEKEIACKRLQRALLAFEQAPIATLHAFCAKMLRQFPLQGDIGLHSLYEDEPLAHSELMGVVRDFFRTEMRIEEYSSAQLHILLKNDPDQRKLCRAIQTPYSFPSYSSFQELYERFCIVMALLKETLSLAPPAIIEDFISQASFYRNAGRETKGEALAAVSRFANLFNKESWHRDDFDTLIYDDLVYLKALDPSLKKTKEELTLTLHYPTLESHLRATLAPLVEEARSFPILLARTARQCRTLLRRYQLEEEKLAPDDLLRKMKKATEDPSFVRQVRVQYHAAIIDEFQDTDPLQWSIFNRLFLSHENEEKWTGYIYLVGDPKQSIYSFRQADIYTYLSAVRALGPDHCFSLDINYRSQPRLVEALNSLFAPEVLPTFIPLPRQGETMRYLPVASSAHLLFEPLEQKGIIHFIIADGRHWLRPTIQEMEREAWFPFIAEEIFSLREQRHISWSQVAILVRDRYQAKRLTHFFQARSIPFISQRGTTLLDSPALPALKDLFTLLIHPEEEGSKVLFLGGPLMGWTHERLHRSPPDKEWINPLIMQLSDCLYKEGIACLLEQLLCSPCEEGGASLREHLASREGGEALLRDLYLLIDLIIDHCQHEGKGVEEIPSFLDHLYTWQDDEDERIKRPNDPAAEGVHVLTLHSSKGLEFDIVFALGLVSRTTVRDELIPSEVQEGEEHMLVPFSRGTSAGYLYCEELDAEKMRQLYVTFTRARLQLYVPLAIHMPTPYLEYGEASPMDLFLGRMARPHCSYEDLYERIKVETGEAFIAFLSDEAIRPLIRYSIMTPPAYQKQMPCV